MANVSKIASAPLLGLIRAYQATLSPDHGLFKEMHPYGFCRFTPSCSEYGYQAIDRFGPFKGVLLAGGRVCRCNPFSKGGDDPVPE